MWSLFTVFVRGKDAKGSTESLVKAKVMAMEEEKYSVCFKMPVDYPRYRKGDYQAMGEDILDRLLKEYGLPVEGSLNHKREYAMGAFLWPDQILSEAEEKQD